MMKLSIFLLILIGSFYSGWGLECNSPSIKVTIKTTTPEAIDKYEQYLFKGVMAYSVRKFCGDSAPNTELMCSAQLQDTDTGNVTISDETRRFAMCVEVDGCSPELLQEAIKYSQPRFNGALVQTDESLLYEGVPVTLRPEVEPAFPIWLIPYIVFISLVVLAAVAIISYTVYKSKKKAKLRAKYSEEEDDESSLSASVYENGGYKRGDNATVTEM